jgi:dephospho-CoA kinase
LRKRCPSQQHGRSPRPRPSPSRPRKLRKRATSSKPRPVSVAITGGIGAGKSEALKAFARHGAAVVSSDEIVHHLIRSEPEVKAAMIERLGEGILDADGHIDRSRVAERVFGDQEALRWLEGLLHPRVSEEYLTWRDQLARLENAPEVTVTEVPLLYEVGGETRFDKVVVITAPAKLREARARVPLAGRSERLLPDKEKVKRADFSYVNTGTLEELDAWVAGVMRELRASREPVQR